MGTDGVYLIFFLSIDELTRSWNIVWSKLGSFGVGRKE